VFLRHPVFSSKEPSMTSIRPPSNAQVAKTTLAKVSEGGAFGKAVKLTGPQLEAFGKNLATLAKTNPERASKLLQRTLDLYGQGKIKVEIDAPVSHAGRNAIASMTNTVSQAILKADPNVPVPAPMMLAR
jgi:hypothetical protein